jgi:hypothetical protein
MAMKNKTNSSRREDGFILFKLLIQLLFLSSSGTLLFLKWPTLNKFGVKFLGAAPSSHLTSQKGMFLPSPTKILDEEKKNYL